MKFHSTIISAIRRLRLLSVLAGLALLSLAALARGGEVNTGHFGKVAIMGYDTVAYFTMEKAVKGSEEHSLDWLGATWHFANEEHRKAFGENPLRYAPQYGGLCALGVAYGEVTRGIDPEAWSVIDGKLYLNYSKNATNDFQDDSAELIKKADSRWPDVKERMTQ